MEERSVPDIGIGAFTVLQHKSAEQKQRRRMTVAASMTLNPPPAAFDPVDVVGNESTLWPTIW